MNEQKRDALAEALRERTSWWPTPLGSEERAACADALLPLVDTWLAEAEQRGRDEGVTTRRDLVSRLGFGDNITEPMADDDTVVAWVEWQEPQLWRIDCAEKGHPADGDCFECDPLFAEDRGRRAVTNAVEAALKLIAPDHITPMGARQVRAAMEKAEGER